METRLWKVEVERELYKNAVLDPAERGFSRLDSNVGTFAVSLQDVSLFADGVRVRLHIGNLTTAAVNGGTFQVKWGTRRPSFDAQDFVKRYAEWSKALREKSMEFQEELRSGTWNNVTLVLPGLPPAQFGYLELSIETPKISLLQPR